MSLELPLGGGSTFVPAPAGKYQAVCVDVVDEGTPAEGYMGQPPKPQIRLVFELNKTFENYEGEERPYTHSEWFTASLHPKAKLRQTIEGWLPETFERAVRVADKTGENINIEDLLMNQQAFLDITHRAKAMGEGTKAVANIMSPMEGQSYKASGFYQRVKDRDDTSFDPSSFQGEVDNMRDKAKGSVLLED